MSLTGQPSSSRRGEKAPMEPLTPLQEKELEIADLQRQVRDFQQKMDEALAKREDLEAEQKAKNEVIDRLTEDKRRLIEDNNYLTMALFTRDSELESYEERIIQLRGTLEDLFGPVPLAASEEAESKGRANPQPEQSGSHNHAEELESQKTLVGLVPVAASTKPESKERASLQLEQSGSDNHAEELESQQTLEDTSEEGFKTVEVKKNKTVDDLGSEATIPRGSLSSTKYLRAIDPDDPLKKKIAAKKVQALNPKPADKRYVVPPPAKVRSDEHSPVGLTILPQRPTSSSAPATNFSTVTGTGGEASRGRHGSKTLPSKGHTAVIPRSEDVGSSATREEAESVMDYAQVAAEPAAPAFVLEGWTDSPGLSETRRRWMKDLLLLARKKTAKEDTEREQKLAEPSGANVPGELIGSSDGEEEQKPDASVQTGLAAATSQTRGKYWPRGAL